jgi:hypothetical protein
VRRVAVAAALALPLLCLGGTEASAAAPPRLDFACSPAPADCSGWYRAPVRLSWDWDDLNADPTDGNCNSQLFSTDTRGTRVFCEVTNISTGEYYGRPVTVRVDQTAPSVSAAPARGPDYNGWFNQPLSVAFTGTDATSGVASCTSAGYGGPDAAGVVLGGSCTDVAGNVSQASFALNYDATPPATPDMRAVPNDHRVRLSWKWPVDAEIVELARLNRDGLPALLYRGANRLFTDSKLRNGRRHRYLLTAIDRAGNRSADQAGAVPTSLPLLNPARGARVSNPPTLIWEKSKRASYYNVQLYRGRKKVLTRWPRSERLQLTEVWRYGNGRRRLKLGRYTWFVFPGIGERSKQRFGRLLGESSFTVVR